MQPVFPGGVNVRFAAESRREGLPSPQLENARTLRTLAAKKRESSICHTFGARRSNNECEKTLVTSGRWLCPVEFVGLAPRDELKKIISLT